MIDKVKNKIVAKIQNVIKSAVRKEIERAVLIITQLIEFQNSPMEERLSLLWRIG